MVYFHGINVGKYTKQPWIVWDSKQLREGRNFGQQPTSIEITADGIFPSWEPPCWGQYHGLLTRSSFQSRRNQKKQRFLWGIDWWKLRLTQHRVYSLSGFRPGKLGTKMTYMLQVSNPLKNHGRRVMKIHFGFGLTGYQLNSRTEVELYRLPPWN